MNIEKNVEMYNRSLSEWDLEKKQNDKLKELTEELKNRQHEIKKLSLYLVKLVCLNLN